MGNYEVYQSGPRKGQCKTIRDRFVRYFIEGRGMYIESKSSTSIKLNIMDKSCDPVYLGSHGSVRRGKSKSSSRDIADTSRKYMELWEQSKGLFVG